MSKFIDAIEASLTGKKSPILARLIEKNDKDLSLSYNKVYELSVRWTRIFSGDERHLRDIIENCKKELAEIFYGDLRMEVINLTQAIYNQDEEAALKCIANIKKEIYY